MEVKMAAKITIQTLLDAGCHYGHQTRRWNPKMKPYIFGERNGIYILDLKQTMLGADAAYTFLKNVASKGGRVLFVGTKKQAQEPIATEAARANMPYINQRWLGGMLTNFVTMRSRIKRLEELEAMVEDGRMATLPKKEQALKNKELLKLQLNLGGVRDMTSLPQALLLLIPSVKRTQSVRQTVFTFQLSPCLTPTLIQMLLITAFLQMTMLFVPFLLCASLLQTQFLQVVARSRFLLKRWALSPRPQLLSNS